MKKIANSITELIGNTPMLNINNFCKANNLKGKIILKLESFNPLSSIKDRIGYAMVKDAIDKKLINKQTLIIEPTSGNTGIALAFVCASLGYKLVLTMPDTMSVERIKIIKALGAQVVLTLGSLGIKGAIKKAEDLHNENANSIILGQFSNPANPQIHKQTTAKEILRDLKGKVDIFVAGVGTGGTLTGVGEGLKDFNKNIKVVAVEPFDSPMLSKNIAGPHKIQGIGAGFIPQVLNTKIYDEVITVKYDDAVWAARQLAKTEGVLIGISGGAALYAGLILAKQPENESKNIVIIMPDTGERYLSTNLFNFKN
jgi:cysteine synthase A